jgi:hypothetical protein
MASDTGITGKNAYITCGGTALQSNYRELSSEINIGLVDQSAGSDVGITRLTTLEDATFSVTTKRPVGGTANWVGLVPGTSGTFEYGPEGTATGKPRQYALCIMNSVSTPLTYNDVVIETFNFQMSDTSGWTRTLY